MLYRKNITRPESLLRVVGGIALIAAGVWWQGMSPLYGKYMNDPTTREELLSIIANK